MPPYVGITRIRFMGSSAGPVRAHGSSQLSSLPRLFDVSLDAERTTAAAASGGIGIIEFEPCTMESVDVIHLGTVHVKQAGLIDKYLQAFEIKHGVALIVEGFVEAHAIGKTGASAADDLDSKPGIRLGLIRQDLPNFFFGFLG